MEHVFEKRLPATTHRKRDAMEWISVPFDIFLPRDFYEQSVTRHSLNSEFN